MYLFLSGPVLSMPCEYGPNCPQQSNNNQKNSPPRIPHFGHILLDSEEIEDLGSADQTINFIENLFSINSQLLQRINASEIFKDYNEEIFNLLITRADYTLNNMSLYYIEDFMDRKFKEYSNTLEKKFDKKLNYLVTQFLSGMKITIPDFGPIYIMFIVNSLMTVLSGIMVSITFYTFSANRPTGTISQPIGNSNGTE